MTKNKLLLIVMVAVIVLITLNLLMQRRAEHGEPLQGAATLSQLPDDQLESATLREMGRSIYGDGASPDAWRSLSRQGRYLWSVAVAIPEIHELGLAFWLKSHADGATSPGPRDLVDGLSGMGLSDAANIAHEIAALTKDTDTPTVHSAQQRLLTAVAHPGARADRLAWIKANLPALVGR